MEGKDVSTRFISAKEVASILGISTAAVRAKVHRGDFPKGMIYLIGKRSYRFDEARLVSWVKSRGYYK